MKPLGSPEEVEVSGAERTNFYPRSKRPPRNSVSPSVLTPVPKRDTTTAPIISASRAWAFPSFSVNEGMKYKGHDEAWGIEQDEEYVEKHYHQPSDEYRLEMDFIGDAAMARFGFALGWEAAMQPKLIGWQKGDEFEAARLKGGD